MRAERIHPNKIRKDLWSGKSKMPQVPQAKPPTVRRCQGDRDDQDAVARTSAQRGAVGPLLDPYGGDSIMEGQN